MNKIRWLAPILASLLLTILIGGCSREQDATPGPGAPDTGQPYATESVTGRTGPATKVDTSATGLPDVGSLPDAGSGPEPTAVPQVYVVQAGDTLSSIASRFGCTLEDLVEANQLVDPDTLQVGQQIQIPATSTETSPPTRLLPNSEFVNGPAYVSFDVTGFCARQGGYLCTYQEYVDGRMLSGPEIVELVTHHYSVGPRLLLAILELESGWVTDPNPTGQALYAPLGYRGGGWDTFSGQLAWAANTLNAGYYNWRGRGMPLEFWEDGTATRYAPTLNAATAGLQYFLAQKTYKNDWQVLVGDGPGSFLYTYRQLFGDPAQYAIEPLIPADTSAPTLDLPWSEGELWFYTGGPHGGWDFGTSEGSAWAAIDVVPDEGFLGCAAASAWATAAAPGLVIYSQDGEVMVDLDGDGQEQTGWVLFYLHLASQGRVPVGTRVEQGDPIGHPSCEGGFSESTHVHFARKYNGEWIAADGPLPLVLSGWQFYSSGNAYDGTASRRGEVRTACECRDPAFNGLVADR